MGENERYRWTIREDRASLLNDLPSHSAGCLYYGPQQDIGCELLNRACHSTAQ